LAVLLTGATNGTRVEWVHIMSVCPAASASTANCVRLWSKKSGGSYYLVREELLSSVTPSATVKGSASVLDFRDKLYLASGDTLEVGIAAGGTAAGDVAVVATGADL
jgi:hypothetical protein